MSFCKQDSQNTTFPLRERSERVGLRACVKHGHVVQSPNCCCLLSEYELPDHHSHQKREQPEIGKSGLYKVYYVLTDTEINFHLLMPPLS